MKKIIYAYQLIINDAKSDKIMGCMNRMKEIFKPTKRKVFFLVIFLLLALQNRFSSHFEYIPRDEIYTNLVKKVNSVIPKITMQSCKYDVIQDNTTYDVPSETMQFHVDEERISAGQYIPKNCYPLFSTAILVPYRNRKSQLDKFIPYMHAFLEKQNIHYRIFIMEQIGSGPWNKGTLFNIGAQIAMDMDFPCLILHDVDLLPLNPANIYACTSQPRHMSANIDKFRYNLPYESLVGGALAILKEHFLQINGYSNKFENWGGEDDELAERLINENLKISRFPPDVSRYTMLKHKQEQQNQNRFKQIKENSGHHKTDGLTTVSPVKVTMTHYNLYTNISIQI